jgi:hypothetical protein
MLTPVFVASHLNEVISLPPEFIEPQDGKAKQDCEIEAGKRWIKKNASFYKGMSRYSKKAGISIRTNLKSA